MEIHHDGIDLDVCMKSSRWKFVIGQSVIVAIYSKMKSSRWKYITMELILMYV
jgi:hypothetical protein